MFHERIFVWPCVLSDRRPCSGGYHLEMGGMSLHDVVGVNCEKETTENQDAGAKYRHGLQGCMLADVSLYLT